MHGTDMVFWTMKQSYKFMLIETLKIASVTTSEFNKTLKLKSEL